MYYSSTIGNTAFNQKNLFIIFKLNLPWLSVEKIRFKVAKSMSQRNDEKNEARRQNDGLLFG